MLVKAKWNVKDAAGWHRSGEVFNTNEDLGDGVEVLEKPKKQEKKQEVPAEKPAEPVKAAEEPKQEKPKAEPAKAKTTPTRRRK